MVLAATLVVDIEVVSVSPSLIDVAEGVMVYEGVLDVSVIVTVEVLPTCVVLFESEKSLILRVSFPSVLTSFARV